MASSTAVLPSPAGTLTGPFRSVRDVVSEHLWDKQVGLLRRDYPYDSVMAARVTGQGYAYLLTAMAKRGQRLGLAPSSIVDIGVHTIILDNVAYAELCNKYTDGNFLHHIPLVEMKDDGSVMKTEHVIAAEGWEVDLHLGCTAPSRRATGHACSLLLRGRPTLHQPRKPTVVHTATARAVVPQHSPSLTEERRHGVRAAGNGRQHRQLRPAI
ncbi:hypothetical protein [Streptomyces sp. SLBN-31]|uniref:hypothetical protein n=1 Tax=Streptomyces sp. SLBN-31 TaxID=2768444 RepID=UPI00116E9F3A|nr:hypothetical protein [Streptomyces sp. SLBN-31]TQJ92772.1 hypothetical protein FBY22_3690 [Streptomyces sp. SLBN-31]